MNRIIGIYERGQMDMQGQQVKYSAEAKIMDGQ